MLNIAFTKHVHDQMAARFITEDEVRDCIRNADKRELSDQASNAVRCWKRISADQRLAVVVGLVGETVVVLTTYIRGTQRVAYE